MISKHCVSCVIQGLAFSHKHKIREDSKDRRGLIDCWVGQFCCWLQPRQLNSMPAQLRKQCYPSRIVEVVSYHLLRHPLLVEMVSYHLLRHSLLVEVVSYHLLRHPLLVEVVSYHLLQHSLSHLFLTLALIRMVGSRIDHNHC